MSMKVKSGPTPGSIAFTPRINLCGLRELDAAIDRYEPDLLISICGEEYERKAADPVIDLYGPLTYRMDFEDVYGLPSSMIGSSKAPHLDMFRGLFTFIDETFPDVPPERILAHCSMGISRSAAVGLVAGAYVIQRCTPAEGWPMAAKLLVSRLLKKHQSIEPNRTALGMGCCLMGDMGADLMQQVRKQIR